jgi:HSP20 family protein
MATLAVQKVREAEVSSLPLFEEMQKLLGDVERKAFALFQSRGASVGHALDDWLQAERETLAAPPAELVETSKEVSLRMVLPGFSAKQVQITATPKEVIVKAEHPSIERKEDEHLCWSELPHNGKVCRRVPLPATVDIDKVAATLDEGILVIKAKKAETPEPREIAVGASLAK